jgi:hypothetical protein
LTEAIRDRLFATYSIVEWGPSDGYELVVVNVPDQNLSLERLLSTAFAPDQPAMYRVEVDTSPLPHRY